MRIHVLSDLHLESSRMPKYVPPECDVVVLAGDISPGLPGVIWAKETFKVPVIYVPGNHEYYVRRSLAAQIEAMRRHAEGSNVIILDNETVDIDGVRFIGSTLWSDFDLYGQNFFHQAVASRAMSDYAFAYMEDDQVLTPEDTLRIHFASRQFIGDELAKPFEGKKVVVTHHGPSEKSVAPKWHLHPLTPAFTSNMDAMILEHGPPLWIHGHTHDSFDYVLGNTRVVVNPRGYHMKGMIENGHAFNDQLVVEL